MSYKPECWYCGIESSSCCEYGDIICNTCYEKEISNTKIYNEKEVWKVSSDLKLLFAYIKLLRERESK